MEEEQALLWLRFADPKLESAYALDHARRSVWAVRLMALVLTGVSALLVLALLLSDAAGVVGLSTETLAEEPFFVLRSAASLLAGAGLILFIGHPAVIRRQQWVITVLISVLVLCDVVTTSRFPLAYGLSATVFQSMAAYILFRLRLRFAVWLGFSLLVSYLAFVYYLQVQTDASLEGALQVNAVLLLVVNIILSVGCYQIERLDRLAFLGRWRADRRSRDLQDALQDLKDAQIRLVESERHASMGRLAAGLLHELNNPLGVVQSTTDTLQKLEARRRPPEGSDRKQGLADAVLASQAEATTRLKEAVDGLARFVNLDREGARTIDLRESLRDTLNLLKTKLEGVDVTFEGGQEPVDVQCEPARMNHALYVVLENAAHAARDPASSKPPHICIDVTGTRARWRIAVQDSGPGVAKSSVSELFEPGFVRSGGRIKSKFSLPTARRSIRTFGGDLSLASNDEGAQFVFDLPRVSPMGP